MVKNVDDRYVDVDFSKEPEYLLGSLDPNFFSFSSYESAVPILSESEIDEAIERIAADDSGGEHLVTRIFDQGREGACVANGCAQANQIIQAKELGIENVVQLSAMSLYKRIGRSPSSGATVSDGIEEMARRGVLPLDTQKNRERYGAAVMPNTGFSERYPADWELTAKHFRAIEYHVVSSLEGIWSALCRRDPVIVGREGHCICYATPITHRGRRSAQYANSWSTNWGFADGSMAGGFGIDTINQVKKSANWAVVVRSVASREVFA